MRNRLLTLTAALALTALASWVPRAEAIVYYCSEDYCAERSPEASCACPPGSDKAGKPSNCEQWFSITAIGCWYE